MQVEMQTKESWRIRRLRHPRKIVPQHEQPCGLSRSTFTANGSGVPVVINATNQLALNILCLCSRSAILLAYLERYSCLKPLPRKRDEWWVS